MAESSAGGALVPAVKSEPSTPPPPPDTVAATTTEEEVVELDRDTQCPICMQTLSDAFLTACGHSFCYMCIFTHLKNKSDCPCCGYYLTNSHIFPNLLLNKLLKKTSARLSARTASPIAHLRLALQQGCEVSVKEVNGLLSMLAEKKRKMEQEEAETSMQMLHDFLYCLRKQKLDELHEIQIDLQCIKEDINAVERHKIELCRARERCLRRLRMYEDPTAAKPESSLIDKYTSRMISSVCNVQGHMDSSNIQHNQADLKAFVSSQGVRIRGPSGGSDLQYATQSGLNMARKRRVNTQFSDLQECYLQKRRHWTSRQSLKKEEEDTCQISREGYSPALKDFQSVLTTFTQYSRLRVIAEVRHEDIFHSANIVSSIEFDRDDELFATAGVSRRIKIFEFSTVVNESTEVQCPLVEMPTRPKLSCLSWNKFTKSQIASSDYDGIVTVWDVTTSQSVMEYEEHEKRAWSVDFSCTEPSMLVSGSDDCKTVEEILKLKIHTGSYSLSYAGFHNPLMVKIWCTRQEASVLSIDMKANICSVKYNPKSSIYVAVGSADHHIHYYDLRNISQPLYVFSGHRKTVSYVKFLSNNELASASTDSTLRLWDVKENLPLRTFRGHTNEKNFVGLTVNNEYIACGSETNEAFVYHKAISKPAASHRFVSDGDSADDEAVPYFISAVCWKSDSPTMLSANSQGTIKVLVLAA